MRKTLRKLYLSSNIPPAIFAPVYVSAEYDVNDFLRDLLTLGSASYMEDATIGRDHRVPEETALSTRTRASAPRRDKTAPAETALRTHSHARALSHLPTLPARTLRRRLPIRRSRLPSRRSSRMARPSPRSATFTETWYQLID